MDCICPHLEEQSCCVCANYYWREVIHIFERGKKAQSRGQAPEYNIESVLWWKVQNIRQDEVVSEW